MVKMAVNLAGLDLDNPIIPASGCFGYGAEFAPLYDVNMLGSFSWKGTTAEPRFGNPTPRIADCPSAMLNSVGLQNPGLERVISEELPRISAFFHKPIVANISGFSIEEYVRCCAAVDQEAQVGIIEVNVSCPNVHGGGMSFGVEAEAAAAVTRAVKAVTTKPVFLKLSPNVTDIVAIAQGVAQAGADGLTLINTLLGMRIDLRRRRPVLARKMGGLSGPALLPLALRMVYQVYEEIDLPIMGCGGVSSAEDVIEMMLAGATAVQVGAANLRNPWACRDIIQELPAVMERYGIEDLSQIIGEGHGE